MSEQILPHEHQSKGAESVNELDHKAILERLQSEATETLRSQPQPAIEELSHAVDSQAKESQAITFDHLDTHHDGGLTIVGTQRALKEQSYERKLTQIQSRLSVPEKSFSKAIHQPTVDHISEAGSKTLFRASGILGGSIAALFGSIMLLYLSKHYGFKYNYLLFFVFFMSGFILAISAEAVIKVIKRPSHTSNK
ncbi:MAG: hypothetical protein NVS1B7_2940 [Candidatus Saccharimonadales bacterium]